MVKTAAIIAAVSFMSACSFSTSTQLPLNPVNDREAIITVIRQGGECIYQYVGRCAFELRLDGQTAAFIANNSYVQFSASAGERVVTLNYPLLSTMSNYHERHDASKYASSRTITEQPMILKGGETRYLLIAGLMPSRREGLAYMRELYRREAEELLRRMALGQ